MTYKEPDRVRFSSDWIITRLSRSFMIKDIPKEEE
jgi:hypothetical protein